MANYLDTGDTGRAVSAESDGALFAGIFGSAKYVLENGSQFKAEVQSNNIVKISDGDAVMYGRHVRIPANDSALVTINNGHSGTNRIDLIVFHYEKDSTGKETVDLAVIQGEDSTGTAAAPATIDGDILTGAMQADFPLYRVELNGLNIVSVTAMFDVIGNISQIAKTNKDLSNKISNMFDEISNTSKRFGNVKRMYGGSKVLNAGKTGTSRQLFSNSEINSLLGVSNSSNGNTAVMVSNGDGAATGVHVEGCTYQNGAWHAVFNNDIGKWPIRINYIITYWG
jgi:hypothetical protein